jgi:hypothetical protein
MRKAFTLVAALAALALAPSTASAGKYDLDLTGLGELQGTNVVQDNVGFRSLASEVGVLMAPKPVDPADSLGLSAFALSADISVNTISNDADFWAKTVDASDTGGAAVPTMQIMGRKGLFPGVEIGAGETKLFDSRMWSLNGYGKIALHEGFHHLPVPSIALRGQFGQLLGSKDLKVQTGSVGASVSHVFGIGSTFNITPYVGYEALFISARSGVIDSTPATDEYFDDWLDPEPCDDDPDTALPQCVFNEFVFKKADGIIVRHRPYLGVRFIFSVLRFGVDAMFVPPGGSSGDVTTASGDTETVKDSAGFQQQYTFTFGLDF